ncbi:hypothetical protein [Sphingomonas jinjuensis]|uniref:hypothetical protein n=1 Tax=Sphingomonas jinjuensis TaxID=535907 RepID=UPI001C8618F9|nr:hypothetical protein [Sphingomonas jinjuensis]
MPPPPPEKERVPSLPYDVIVEGVPRLDERTSAVTSSTLGSSKVGNALKTHIAFEGVESLIRCGGNNARRVYFDPTHFRLFIADALYRWLVAAQGVDTLIPAPLPPG